MYDLNELERIGEGRLSTVYRLDGERMLKVFKYPNLADYEFRQTSAAWQAGVSRQRPHAQTSVDGKDAIIFDYIEGDLLMSAIKADMPHAVRYFRKMANCHAKILMGESDSLPDVKGGMEYAISHAPHLGEAQRKALLQGLKGMPEGNHVLHGDLHPMNLLIQGGETTAIDWMTAGRGDPAADIARSYFILRYSMMKDDRNLLESAARKLQNGIVARAYLSRVCETAGVTKKQVRNWLPFIAAARLAEDRPPMEVRTILGIVNRYMK